MLFWDWAALMPEGGAAARTGQLAALEGVAHELLTAADLSDLVQRAAAEVAALGPWEQANLKHMERRIRRARALPAALIEARTKARASSELRWRRAKAKSDFTGFLEEFAPLLSLVREAGKRLGAALGLEPYDALLDGYQPGLTAARIESLFAELARALPPLIEEALARQAREPPVPAFEGRFPMAAQRALAASLMAKLGFDFSHGRLDVSAHPFCGGVPDDVRITTRYDEGDFAPALMAVLHETGHALYQQGLPAPWRDQPVGEAAGMAVHESQSLLIEMQLCRGPAFLSFVAPLIAEAFAAETSSPAFHADNLARRYLRVERGLIRVDADEATYSLHVLLRYRLERALIAGELAPAELPEAWQAGMSELLGVSPANDREGCLQDIHWAEGLIGYFPTYTIGALAAAQLFEAARRALPGLEQATARGDFAPLIGWLRANVHGLGSLYDGQALIERASGQPLSVGSFLDRLRRRYLGIGDN